MPSPLWSVVITVPAARAGSIEAVEAALEPFAEALSIFEVKGGGAFEIEALCRRRPGRRLEAALRVADGSLPPPVVRPVPERNWVRHSRRALAPFRAGRFFVHGAEYRVTAPRGTIPLLIDAGLAFGTGRHATTKGCLLALARLARGRRIRKVLDLGCGTGILAIAAARLGIGAVLAADSDPAAIVVARENAALNGVADRVRVVKSDGFRSKILQRSAPFDLILANILARPLMRLAPSVARYLAPKGAVVLSGLMTEQEDEVQAAYRRHGLRCLDSRRDDDWSVLILGR